jgi:hypothetical protein
MPERKKYSEKNTRNMRQVIIAQKFCVESGGAGMENGQRRSEPFAIPNRLMINCSCD